MSDEPSATPGGGGVLPVDKPVGPTSHDIVARARRALGTRRVGHVGTLDPLASGLLVLCVGPATRLSQFLVGAEKCYRTTIRLGVGTDSLDAEGEVVGLDDDWRCLTGARVRAAVAGMVGSHEQVPPALSAKKVGGVPAHRRVRRGEDVELEPVPVTIHQAEAVRIELPEIELDVRVSSGTFVRSLARDLAAALGTLGHVAALRRTAVGSFRLEDAVPMESLERPGAQLPWVDPLAAIAHLPLQHVEREAALRLAFGQRIPIHDETIHEATGPDETGHDETGRRETHVDGALVRVAHAGRLVAVAEVEGNVLRPRKVFVTPDEFDG